MKTYHSSSLGSLPNDTEFGIEFSYTLTWSEFAAKYSRDPETFGEVINLDAAGAPALSEDHESPRCGEVGGELIVAWILAEAAKESGDFIGWFPKIEVWTGKAVQDIDGYCHEADGEDSGEPDYTTDAHL
jgi:hypothetical protein